MLSKTESLPREVEKIQALAAAMYKRMLGREDEAIEKFRKVITLATTDDCTSSIRHPSGVH